MSIDRKRLDMALRAANATAAYWLERFMAEIDFAEGLCNLKPRSAKKWRDLIEQAGQPVAEALDRGAVDALPDAVAKAEDILQPLGKVAKEYTVHCIGHAHIDMNWQWSWPETVAITNDTFLTVLKLMDEFPDFRFSQSQASVYHIVEQHHPELLKRIAERVKQGRWEVTASHWVEGDKNLASGESLCRHLLTTRRYMQALFDLSPEDVPVDWSPDTFGHAATIPTYLVRGGVKYLYLHRPGVHTDPKPEVFWWEAPDGSRVLTRNDMRLAYNGKITPRLGGDLLQFAERTKLQDFMFVFGVGDHGGGPTRRDLLRATDLAEWPIFPEIRFSTVRAWFQTVEESGVDLPVVDMELNTEFTGCYTSESLIKRSNRFAENRLVDAEFAAAGAWALQDHPYSADTLEQAWRDTLFSHFHDILPGSGVHDTRTYCHGTFQRIMATTGMVELNALRAMAARVDTSSVAGPDLPEMPVNAIANALGAGVGFGTQDGALTASEQSGGSGNRAFVVFNPTQWRRRETIEITCWENALPDSVKPLKERRFVVRDAEGNARPAQQLNDGTYWGHEYVTLAVPVDAPAFGYALIAIEEDGEVDAPAAVHQTGRVHHCRYSRIELGPEGLENAHVRVDIDPATGGIIRLVERKSGLKLIDLASAPPLLEYLVERPHGMSSWLLDEAASGETPKLMSLRRTQKGPHVASLDMKYRVSHSDFTLTLALHADDPRIHLHLHGTWFERGTPETGVPALRMAFPLALTNAVGSYEVPFGAVERDINTGEEVPALRWAQVSGLAGRRKAGCLLANDSKYGHSLKGNVLRLSLIRSSYTPDPLPEIGEHDVRLTLMPFAGSLSISEATRLGAALNHPLKPVGTGVHDGDLPTTASLLDVSPANVLVSSVKKAEDEDALIVRLYETAGRKTTAKVVPDKSLLGRASLAEEVDLIERPNEKHSAACGPSGVTVDIPARGIATVRIHLRDK